jgi:hypothetical protein
MGRSLAAVVLAAAWVATWRPQLDPDAWWHLAIGDSIIGTGGIPVAEPFSWLTPGDRFVAHSWLWDVLLAVAWQWAGATGTSLLALPVNALIIWLTWLLIGLTAPTMPPLGRAVLVLASVIAVLPLWAPRAQTLDLVFVLGTVLVLARYLHFGAGRELVALPLIGILWANLHGSAVLALAVCVVLAVVGLPIGVRWGSWQKRPIGRMFLAGIAGMVATALNPYGPGLLAYPFDRSVASAFTPAIVEWQSPDFGAVELWPFRVVLAGTLLVAIWVPSRSRDPYLLLAAAAWTFAALGAVRFLAIAAPLIVIALAPAVGLAVARWLDNGADREFPAVASERPRASPGGISDAEGGPTPIARPLTAIAAIAVIAVLAAGWRIIDPARQDAAIERRLPVAAVAALQASGCEARLLASYGWAGYVIWSTRREVGAYGNSAEEPVVEQARLEAVALDPRAWLDVHDVGAVLMPAEGSLTHWLEEAEDWRLAYRDGQATIHVRANRRDCAIDR